MAPSLKQKMTAELNSRDQVQHLSQHQQRGPGGMGTTHSALDSPGGIWDDSMREMMAQRKPALNDSTLIQGVVSDILGLVGTNGCCGAKGQSL